MRSLGGPLLTSRQEKASRHLYGMFPMMVDIVPEMDRGEVSIRHAFPDHERAWVEGRLRNELRTAEPMVQLDIGETGWMFDTLHEKWMNRTAVVTAHGDVLLGGLGMGLILWPILRRREVRTVTVLENNADIISLILPTLASAKGIEKLSIIEGDGRTWTPKEGVLYDYIWLDCVPCYGYGSKFLDIHGGWIERYSKFHRGTVQKSNRRMRAFEVDHWGYQENLLWCMHRPLEQEDWPREDNRPYPIGPPDPFVAAIAQEWNIGGVPKEFKGKPDKVLIDSMRVESFESSGRKII